MAGYLLTTQGTNATDGKHKTMTTSRVLHLLTGPTAVGKTEWALRWAERHSAEIVSCDSLLFYRGMEVGTAKPAAADLARVRHHLIDLCQPVEQMDIARYVGEARTAIAGIVARGHPVLVTGGSGFYLKAFLAPVADDVVVPAALRAEVAGLTGEAALVRLRAVNPEGPWGAGCGESAASDEGPGALPDLGPDARGAGGGVSAAAGAVCRLSH